MVFKLFGWPVEENIKYNDVVCFYKNTNSETFIERRIRAGIFKPLWSPGIDAKASTPPAYVAWRAGTITLFLVGA